MSYYRPRHYATITVPVFEANSALAALAHGSDTVTIPLVIKTSRLVRNNHMHADELFLTCEWRDVGVDPRFLKSCTVDFFICDAGESGILLPSLANEEFTGVCTNVSRVARMDGGFEVSLQFHDYTSFFLAAKPFETDGIPDFGATLTDAWKLICDFTGWKNQDGEIISSVERLRDRLEFRGGVDPTQALGKKAVLPVVQKLGSISETTKDSKSAWDVWQYCCNILGLITFIEGDKCIVTTALEHFSTGEDIHLIGNPAMVWGQNIAEFEEHVSSANNMKGICLTSFDPIRGTVLESFYPGAESPLIHIKRSKAKKKGSPAPLELKTSDYTYFPYNFATTQDALDGASKRVWEEFSRQDMTGKIVTHEMSVNSPDGKAINLLKLKSGDPIRIEIERGVREKLSSDSDDSSKLRYLVNDLGYNEQIARLLVANADALDTLTSDFVTQTATINLSDTAFSVEIAYCSYISAKGHTKDLI